MAKTKFGYWRDSLFWLAMLGYAVNRWFFIGHLHTHNHLLRWYFDDFLLVPCALPPLLWAERRLGLRSTDGAPTACELIGHWFIWSICFIYVAPLYAHKLVSDPWNMVAYGLGGIGSWMIWNGPLRVGATVSSPTPT